MTKYNSQDMEGWEFKIVRANTNRFKNPEKLRQVCDEEAKTAWELIEKFDNQRLRFKRRTDRRANDQFAKTDPYRTSIGISEGQIVMIVVAILLVAGGVALTISMR